MLEPDDSSSSASPRAPRHRSLERANESRARTRALLLRTTLVTALGLVGFGALFGLRRSAPVDVAHIQIDGGAAGAVDAARAVPIVTLRDRRVLLDGEAVDTTSAAIVDGGRVQRLDGLLDALKRRRPERDSRERSAIIDATGDTPAIVVKSVFQTLLLAGYSDVSFALPEAGAP